MIRDEMKLYQTYDSSTIRCTSCSKSNHLVQRCPYIHYIPDKSFILKRHIYSEEQERCQSFPRKHRKKFKVLNNLGEIDEALEKLWENDDIEEIGDYFENEQRTSIDETNRLGLGVLAQKNGKV